MPNPTLLTPEEAAAILHLDPATLRNWRHRRIRLRYVKAGKLVFYQADDVEAFRLRYHRIIEVDENPKPAKPRPKRAPRLDTTPDGIMEVATDE